MCATFRSLQQWRGQIYTFINESLPSIQRTMGKVFVRLTVFAWDGQRRKFHCLVPSCRQQGTPAGNPVLSVTVIVVFGQEVAWGDHAQFANP